MYMEITLDSDDDFFINPQHGLKQDLYFDIIVKGESQEEIFNKAMTFIKGIKTEVLTYAPEKKWAADYYVDYCKKETLKALRRKNQVFSCGGNQTMGYKFYDTDKNYDLVL